MTDVLVVSLALAALALFGLSAWVSVTVFRRARRGQDVVLPSYPFGGDVFGGGAARDSGDSRWFDGGGSESGSGDGGGS